MLILQSEVLKTFFHSNGKTKDLPMVGIELGGEVGGDVGADVALAFLSGTPIARYTTMPPTPAMNRKKKILTTSNIVLLSTAALSCGISVGGVGAVSAGYGKTVTRK